MSQVIVTKDKLTDKRERSAQQERHIEREAGFARWRKSDITGSDPFASGVGYAVVPVLALWTLLCTMVVGVFRIIAWVFKVIGGVSRSPTAPHHK